MASLFKIQAPDSIAVGLNVSYTVPAGKLALIHVMLAATNGATTPSSTALAVACSSEATTSKFIAPSGTVINSSRVTNNGSTSTIRSVDATVTMTVNGNNSLAMGARASGVTSTGSVTTAGTVNFGFYVEEYLA